MVNDRKKFINDFLGELNKIEDESLYAVTGSFALYLHSILQKNTFPREVKDLDICVFGKLESINNQDYLDQFSIKNSHVYSVDSEKPDFYMDVFSNGYLANTIFPDQEKDLVHIEVGELKVQVSSVEHILMLKLCSTCGFSNTKNLFDIKYILNSYSIDLDKCRDLLRRSNFSDLNLNINNITSPERLNLILAEISRKITKKYAVLPINFPLINYEHLVTLQHFKKQDVLTYTQANEVDSLLSDKTGMSRKKKELYRLAYFYLSAGLNRNLTKLFTLIDKATAKYIRDNHQLDSLLMMSRQVNNLLRNSVTEKQVSKLLNEESYLLNYFALCRQLTNYPRKEKKENSFLQF